MSGITLSQASAMKPRNVVQITESAQEYEYNAQVPLRYWLRSASALLKEADIYMREGDDETTYMLFFRHAHLVLANLTAHPEAKDHSLQPLLAQAERQVKQNLKVLDALKPKINQRYERYTKIIKERESNREAQRRSTSTNGPVRDVNEDKVQHLYGHEHRELAVRLAQQEYLRRAGEREFSGRTVPQSRGDGDDISQRLQAIRSRMEAKSSSSGGSGNQTIARAASTSSGYAYPSVRPQGPHPTTDFSASLIARPTESIGSVQVPPSLPPKLGQNSTAGLPPRPDKVHSRASPSSEATTKPLVEPVYTFKSSAFLENGNPLRTLFLPPTLRTTFLRLAHKNTRANLETCGFLAGTLISNALFVSKLIIPAQVSTSDTCEMTNESQLFDYVDSVEDLMVLGWIHTHPSQTCFMSSRDLHTHAGYQMMLPESVAVVCAPSKGDTSHGGDWGVYRLTDPPGKMAILNCNKPGIFHPHEVENVYTDAMRPGHVVEANGLEFEVVDLRTEQ